MKTWLQSLRFQIQLASLRSGKNRFKAQPAGGMAYDDMAAQKKANKAAMAAKKKGGPR